MNSNSNAYNFKHDIPMEVYHELDECTIEIHINAKEVWSKTFAKGIVHYEKVEFYYNYIDYANQKNIIKIFWTGQTEAKNKYLRLKRMYVNYQRVDLNQLNYYPESNNYFNSLTFEEMELEKRKIYMHGGYFGWFGEITTDLITMDHYGAVAPADRDHLAASIGRHIPMVTKHKEDQKEFLRIPTRHREKYDEKD